MNAVKRLRRTPRLLIVAVVVAALSIVAVAYAATPAIQTITPNSADQMTNIDVARQQAKNYYGDPLAVTGSGTSGTWKSPLNLQSNYAHEAESVASKGESWLKARSNVRKRAIVLDVDDTTLTTWNYEIYSNWDFNFGTNSMFVNNEWFPATPGMVDMVNTAKSMGYAVFFVTGRPAGPTGFYEDATKGSQYKPTLANLTTGDWDGVVTTPSSVDAGYPAPDPIDRTGDGTNVGPGLFLKPPIGSYPAYLDKPAFCKAAIDAGTSCPTIQYKSGTRAYIESQGYDIVGDFGDQYSDLTGGYADKTFKMPNPNYFLP